MTHIKYPSINQYRQIVKNIRSSADYHNLPYPKITFECSIKVHGSNGSWTRPIDGTHSDVRFQSRERFCTIESDNAGFAFWSHANLDTINAIMDRIQVVTGKTAGTIQVYGEWFGGNIQKGVGVTGLPKMFMIFGIRISDDAESIDWEFKEVFIQTFGNKFYADLGIYTKYDFPVTYVEVDFNRPELSQNAFVDASVAVENDCPVARYFKADAPIDSLIGEGIVAIPMQTEEIGFDVRHHFFKVKGEKHSVSKVKTTATLDPEKMTSHREFVEKTLTENRMLQGVDKMRELGHPMDITSTGLFIRWVSSDIFREEADTMVASMIEPKDVMGIIATTAKKFWFDALNKEAGL